VRAPYLTSRLQGFGTTIFAEMSELALATGSINLGQGYPDTDGPREVAEAAVAAIRAGHNQYTPGRGVPELLTAVATHEEHWYGLEFDPASEVLATCGATEAIAASLLALCEVGDEVVMFEPYYDSYRACTAMAGAGCRLVRLRPPDWSFDPAELSDAVSPRTRLIVVNSPHNPTGKVFSREELEAIARVCVEHDLIAVTDEVYEHLVFSGEHIPLASLPGMRERTVTISSAGKTFSFTGWKVGWACASPPLLDAVRAAKQFLTYVSGAPLQHAVAFGLGLDDAVFHGIAEDLRARRDLLAAGLEALGFEVFVPSGTYFVTTDIRQVGYDDGRSFCTSLPRRCGVVAIPSSVFYDDARAGRSFVRWTFCKRREVLEDALRRLQAIAR
jgi:N-succinyldiaminopimelate aminotransferase